MIITSSKSDNKDKFWKKSFMLGSKSPINICKIHLCTPISLGAQVQISVKKITKFLENQKEKECNLDKTDLYIFKRKWDLCPKNL